MSVYSKNNVPTHKVKRNTFDLSRQNNGTYSMGVLYPVLLQEVIPGDSCDLNVTFGLRMMPLNFPIQTKVRADVHFFYVRSRNLWSDWPDFIGNNNSRVMLPVVKSNNMRIETGSLADYLGVPTTVIRRTSPLWTFSLDELSTPDGSSDFMQHVSYDKGYGQYPILFEDQQYIGQMRFNSDNSYILHQTFQVDRDKFLSNDFLYVALTDDLDPRIYFGIGAFASTSNNMPSADSSRSAIFKYYDTQIVDGVTYLRFEIPHSFSNIFTQVGGNNFNVYIVFTAYSLKENWDSQSAFSSEMQMPRSDISFYSNVYDDVSVTSYTAKNYPVELSALPFRAYESIYNAFYRDQRNNPIIRNGELKPNDYLPTKAGGYDITDYDFHRRNWEQDHLTTALTSPQQGVAPLVGITSTGVATFTDDDGTSYDVKLITGDDGNTIVGADYTSNLPNSVARSIVNIASSGISINDFRAVNSLQRWLETNVRRGLKYKDQIASHFGVHVSYAELDMPEFLGGFSEYVNIDQINQTSAGTSDDPLGSYAGQGSLVGGSRHRIKRHFDEHGFIVGILSVVPVPTYSQLLPKIFTKKDVLDFYFPEFGHIGYQPIPYKEVCPLQVTPQSGVRLTDTFGYQRPWYDYLSATDECHGQFRDTLRHFLLMRTFNSVPSINEDFLLVDENSMNQVFAVDGYDSLLGQLHFDFKMKRPIPRYGIPRLE